MEDLQRNLEKELAAASLPKLQREKKRWTLLFVGDHGKTIAVNRFRGLLFVWLFLVLSAIFAAVVLYYLYLQSERKNRMLDSAVQNLQRQVGEIRNEKDLLTARLVVTESALKKHQTKGQKDHNKDPVEAVSQRPAKASVVSTAREAANPVASAKLEKAEAEHQEPPKIEKPSSSPPADEASGIVKVEDVKVSYELNSKTFRAQFTLRNTRTQSEPIAGYTAVVLKNNETQPGEWITLPTVILESGKPAGHKRGQYFSIARFKTVKFKTVDDSDPAQYNTANVFVFDSNKELIFEEAFPVTIERE